MITRILDVSDAEEHIDSMKVAPTDSTDLATWNKIDSISMLIIMDRGAYSPSHFSEKDHSGDMDNFGESVPKKERESVDSVAREGEITLLPKILM